MAGMTSGVRVGDAYDDLAPQWDRIYTRTRDRAEDRIVGDLLREGGYGSHGTLLDVGCGTGLVLDLLPTLSPWQYTGLDVSTGMLACAEAKRPKYRFDVGDVVRMPNAWENVFNTVVSTFCALSYVLDLRRAAAEIARVLVPGGKVFLMVYGWRTIETGAYEVHAGASAVPRYACGSRLRWAMAPYFKGIRSRALTIYTDNLPDWMTVDQQAALIRLESNTLGRLFQDEGYFTIVEAVRR